MASDATEPNAKRARESDYDYDGDDDNDSDSESEMEGGEDRLSDLPDCILIHIMTFLTTKDVVGTSLLSRRWKDLWKHVPRRAEAPRPRQQTLQDVLDELRKTDRSLRNIQRLILQAYPDLDLSQLEPSTPEQDQSSAENSEDSVDTEDEGEDEQEPEGMDDPADSTDAASED